MYDLSDVFQFIYMASRCYVRSVRRVSVYRYGKLFLCTICRTFFTLQIWQVVMFDLSDVFPLTDGKTLCTICLTHLSLQIWQVVVMYDRSDVYQFIDMASRYVRFVRRVSVYRYGKSLCMICQTCFSLYIWQVVVMYDLSGVFQFTDMASRYV